MVKKRKAEELLNNMIPDQSAFGQGYTGGQNTEPTAEKRHRDSKRSRTAATDRMPRPNSFMMRMLAAGQIQPPGNTCPSQKRSHRDGKIAQGTQGQGPIATLFP